VGPNFGAIVGAIFLLLNIGWFADASGILADSRMLLGKKVMSWQVLFPRKIRRGIGAGMVSTVPYLKLS
jgi:hypothetical protein